ncbi:MAG TPA: type VI secretion system PAAR protein, partial [Marinobacter sp.]|nr:type VI secretion system PAAR protein [Marinobacter sp.]
MSKPIVLLGDLGLDHEGYPPTPVISGSPDVMVDGKPAARVGDQLAMHSKPFHPPHPRTIAEGSSTVMINGVPAAITGGKVSCGGVTIGSGSVVIGDSPAPAAFSGSTPLPARKAPASAGGQNSTTTSSPSQARSPSPV